MLAPKRVKFRKRFKGRTSGMATRGNTVAFGHYGLMSLEPGWISNRQIEAAPDHVRARRDRRGRGARGAGARVGEAAGQVEVREAGGAVRCRRNGKTGRRDCASSRPTSSRKSWRC